MNVYGEVEVTRKINKRDGVKDTECTTGQAHPYIHEGTQPKRNVGQTSSPFHAILLSAAREDHTRRQNDRTTEDDTTRHNATADSTHTHTHTPTAPVQVRKYITHSLGTPGARDSTPEARGAYTACGCRTPNLSRAACSAEGRGPGLPVFGSGARAGCRFAVRGARAPLRAACLYCGSPAGVSWPGLPGRVAHLHGVFSAEAPGRRQESRFCGGRARGGGKKRRETAQHGRREEWRRVSGCGCLEERNERGERGGKRGGGHSRREGEVERAPGHSTRGAWGLQKTWSGEGRIRVREFPYWVIMGVWVVLHTWSGGLCCHVVYVVTWTCKLTLVSGCTTPVWLSHCSAHCSCHSRPAPSPPGQTPGQTPRSRHTATPTQVRPACRLSAMPSPRCGARL